MTGILFIARLGSARLSNKHLIEVNGKTFIEWLVSRYAYEFEKEIAKGEVKLFIATSKDSKNKQFESLLNHLPVSVFYGHDENIPLRQAECAEESDLKSIISIDGDDILCSVKAAREIYSELNKGARSLVKTSGLPFGMNAMGYPSDFLKRKISQTSGKLETGWGRIFENEKAIDIILGNYSENKDLRFTLDYELDAEFFKTVIAFLGNKVISISDEDLIKLVLEKQFFEINRSLHDEYWLNFNKQKSAEA